MTEEERTCLLVVVGASPGGPEPVYQWCPGPSDKLSGHPWSKGSAQLAGWLVLWETEGQPLPKQRPSSWPKQKVLHVPRVPACLAQPSVLSGRGVLSRSLLGRWRILLLYRTSQMGWGCQTQQHWPCTGDRAGHHWQRGPTPKRPALGQLICTQGPPL